MFDVITFGSASRDIFFITNRGKLIPDPASIEGTLFGFGLGSKVSIEDAHISTGGGACNAGTSFSRLGLNAAVHCNVGRDELGEQVILELIQEGADTEFIWVDETLRTGTSLILIPEGVGDRTILFYSGANRNLRVHDWHKLEDTKWFYISPLSRQLPRLLPELVEFAHARSIKIANNPGMGQIESGFEYMAPILERLDVLIVNRTEATYLLRSKEPGLGRIADEDLAMELKKTGPAVVVVTCGSDGSYATDDERVYHQEALRVDAVDATGAGDSFGSTVVAALMMGQDIKTAMFMAAINSASVVSKVGAQDGLLRMDEIRKRALKARAGMGHAARNRTT